jgi:hypothetical protein
MWDAAVVLHFAELQAAQTGDGLPQLGKLRGGDIRHFVFLVLNSTRRRV